ncbi:MAG TPA: hypothetical protein VMR52_11320 [Dehalococcoidia bacterium]|nr:hypothetical protein [Dehalococcoidia bacterium]
MNRVPAKATGPAADRNTRTQPASSIAEQQHIDAAPTEQFIESESGEEPGEAIEERK